MVVFADLDGLKIINDGHGHHEGDRALKKAAEVLMAVFRDTDLVARLGGDEFAILALDCSPSGMVRINAHLEKMLRAVNNLEKPWKLSISVGTVHVDGEHPLSIDEVAHRSGQSDVPAQARQGVCGCGLERNSNLLHYSGVSGRLR